MANVSVVDIGKLTKPATILIEKISNAIGVMYEPRRIKNIAKAEAEASKTKALMDLEIEDIQKRALTRLVTEEIKKQENIESITEKSFSSITEDAKPEDIEDDWISNFFDKCKLISDDKMQTLWSKILAGEVNKPGTFSKRTIEFLSTMDKKDAILFDNLCRFSWNFGEPTVLIIDYEDEIFKKFNISFSTLHHLADIGLVNFSSMGYSTKYTNRNSNNLNISYYGRILTLNIENKKDINMGSVIFTKIGKELATIIHPNILGDNGSIYKEYVDEYYHYIVEKIYFNKNMFPDLPELPTFDKVKVPNKEIKKKNIILSEPLDNKIYAF